MPVFLELSLACVSSVCALRGRLVPDGMSVYAPRGTLVRLSLCARRGRLARFSVLFRADCLGPARNRRTGCPRESDLDQPHEMVLPRQLDIDWL